MINLPGHHRKPFWSTQGLSIAIVVVVAVLTMTLGWFFMRDNVRQDIGGAFRLTDHKGNVVTHEDLTGRWTLLTFGYTSCPSSCDYLLDLAADQLGSLDERKRAQVRLVFVTLDPDRDDHKALADYIGQRSYPVRALRGSAEETEKILDAYRIFHMQIPTGSPSGDYLIDYTSVLYILDRSANYHAHVTDEADAQTLRDMLQEFL